jgi:hypothetical protein
MTTVYNIYPEHFREILSAIISETIRYVYLHPVNYTHVYKPLLANEIAPIQHTLNTAFADIMFYGSDGEEEEGDTGISIHNQMNKDIIKLITKKGWDTPIIKGVTHFTVESNQTGNDDSRGGGCGGLDFTKEDFIYNKELGSNVITLKDITEGCYRMKGSKYDWWYELFSGVGYRIHNGGVTFTVDFGYGS